MNSFINFFKKSYFVILPLLLSLIMLMLKAIMYDSADDVFLYEMANSFSSNAHSEYLMFISVIYGYVFKVLYTIIPAVNWFSVIYISLVNLIFASLLYITKKNNSNVIFIIIICGLELYILHRISFTAISFIGSATSVLWYIENVTELKKENIKHICYSFLLLLLSFGMRGGDTFYFSILIFLPLYFFSVYSKRNSVATIALILALLVCSNYFILGVQKYAYSKLDESMFYAEFQEYRSKATDSGLFEYEKHKDSLSEHGVSENDYNLYRNYIYADKKVFNGDAVKAISERDFSDKYNTDIKELIKKLITYDLYHNLLLIFVAFALILFVVHKNKRIDIFFSSGFLIAAELYLFIRRRPVPRVVNPVAIVGMIILIYIVMNDSNYLSSLIKKHSFNIKRINSAIICTTVAITVAISAFNIYYQKKHTENYNKVFDYIQDDNEHTYLSYSQTRNYMMDKHLTLFTKNYYKVPIYMISGDWQVYTYYWYDLLEQLELSDYTDMSINALLDDNVLFITMDNGIPDMLVTFYKEHYNYNVDYSIVQGFSDENVTVYDFNLVEK